MTDVHLSKDGTDVPARTSKDTLTIESESFEYIPPAARFGTIPDQRKFWFMVNATLVTVFTGTVGPYLGLGLTGTLIAVVLGSLAGTVFQALHAAQGPVMGLPQMIQSRVQFGSRGALIPLIAAVIALAGFPMFSIQTGASALSVVTPIGFSASQIVVGLVAGLVAVVGFRLLLRAEKIMAWISVASFLLLSIAVVCFTPWTRAFSTGGTFVIEGFVAQLAASAVLQLGIAPFVSDYTRYLPIETSKRGITSAVFGGTLISAIWISILGSIAVCAFPHSDPISALRALGDRSMFGIGTLTLIVAVPAAALSAATGFYSAAISLLTGIEAFRHFTTTRRIRSATVSVLCLLAIVAGLLLPPGVSANFGAFLTLLGYMLVPWTAINLIDFYVIRREVYSVSDIVRSDGGMYGTWSWRGLVAYFAALFAMLPFVSTSLFQGPFALAFGGADISFAVGLVVASGVSLALNRGFDRVDYLTRVANTEITTLPARTSPQI